MTNRILVLVFLLLSLTASAQRVDPNRNSHFRFRCIDKLVTGADGVRRPAHAGNPKLAWAAVVRGNMALVEYVAKDWADLEEIRADFAKETDPRLKAFDKARSAPAAIEAAARAAGFTKTDLDKLQVRVP